MSKRTFRIHFKYQHFSDLIAVLSVASVLCFSLIGLGLSYRRGIAQPKNPAATFVSASERLCAPLRQYYVTPSNKTYTGADADGNDGEGGGNCAIGYHFASIWEILDTSNLRYNVNQGASRDDSGMGPPSLYPAWVRTGYSTDNSSTPGSANCNGWDTNTGYGTYVYLPHSWTSASLQDIHTWNADTNTCSSKGSIMCVADEPDGSGSCSQPETIYCGQQVAGNTSGMPSHIAEYACVNWDESGPESIYELTLPAGATYTVTASLSGTAPALDLDVFFVESDSCYAGGCQTPTSFGLTAVTLTDLSPGTYYIAVDGYAGDAGAYTLRVDCSQRFVYLPLVVK